MSTDPLRTMRDEMAYRVEIWNRPDMEMVERWSKTLDAYLALPRCPECGTHVKPKLHVSPDKEECCLYRCFCGHEGCIRGNEADALAAFYEANP